MGLNNSKLECIWLPGQSGKTRNVVNRIKTLEEYSSQEYDCDGFLNIIISANNRSLVDQTEVRLNKELYRSEDEEELEADSRIEGSCFKWHSGLKKNNVSVSDLADKIKEGEITAIVCCAHAKRFSYLLNLLKNLEKSRFFKKKINIWIDEADATIKLWSKEDFDVSCYNRVSKITLVSATYDSILKKYGKIKVIPFLMTISEVYHKFQDSDILALDILAEDAPDYLRRIIQQYEDELCKPGVRLFAPGDVERSSHDQIAEFLSSKGFAVVILNGLRKEIIIPGREKAIQLSHYIVNENEDPEEIGKIIAKIYRDNNLSSMPFAITGHLCLGRGITFQNEHFLFTHGVIFDIPDKANAYQTACRLLGNIKGYASYSSPTVLTTTKMMNTIIEKENTAINIARHVYENELQYVDSPMLKCLYGSGKIPVREEDFRQEWREFTSQEEAKEYAKDIHEKKQDDKGFYLSSFTGPAIVLPYSEILRAKEGKKTANMPAAVMKLNEVRHRLYVAYKDTSDPSTAVFVVRRLTRIHVPKF